jgi:hypothetical protein
MHTDGKISALWKIIISKLKLQVCIHLLAECL